MNISKEKLKDIIKLENKKYRNINNEYLIFGKHIVDEAIKSKQIKLILVAEEYLYEEYIKSGIEIYLITKKELDKFKSLKNIPPVLGVCDIYNMNIEGGVVLGINKVNNPNNLGSILRSAKAFGINNIVLDYETVDLYNPKTIQAMQGVNFSLNIVYDDLYTFTQDKVEKENFKLITSFLDESNDFMKKSCAIGENNDKIVIIGNEALGIEEKFKELEHINFKIDIAYESLNVVVATSIIMYEIMKGKNEK